MVDAPGETIRDLNKYIFISKMLRCRNTKKRGKVPSVLCLKQILVSFFLFALAKIVFVFVS
jgi:hypothetical protein